MPATRSSTRPAPRTLVLSAQGQEALWRALNAPVKLTPAQKELGALMRKAAE